MGGCHQRAWRAAVANGNHFQAIGTQWLEQVLIGKSATGMHYCDHIAEFTDLVVLDIFYHQPTRLQAI